MGVLAFAPLSVTAAEVDPSIVLHAIHLVENPTNSTHPGRHGELGPYQFRSTTWRTYTSKSFQLANNRTEADAVAELHYKWIKDGLEKAGFEATPYRIALVWNAGLTATVKGRLTSGTRSYARRVENLVNDMQREVLAQKKREDEQRKWVEALSQPHHASATEMGAAAVDEPQGIVFSLARSGGLPRGAQ